MGGQDKFFNFKFAIIFIVGFFIFGFFEIAEARTNISASVVDITEDTTWTLENSPYVISDWAWLDIKATLTIEAGVVVKFIPDNWNHRYNGIQASSGGKIIAIGTRENPIIFTSYYDDEYAGDTNADLSATSPTSGDWRGIIFDADESELSNVKILYASNIYQSFGAVEAKNGSSASFTDSIIQYCAGSCVRLNEPNTAQFSNVTISDTSHFAIYSTANESIPSFSDVNINNCISGIANLFVGNTIEFNNISLLGNKNAIELNGSIITKNAIWPKISDSEYIIRNAVEVADNASLTIDPGVVIKSNFGDYPRTRLEVHGTLLARGTELDPIIFTSLRDVPSAGDWGGLYFEDSSGSLLEYIDIKYGGRFFDDFSGVMYATTDYNMIHLKNSSVSFLNSIISNASSVGIYLEGESNLEMQNSLVGTTTTGILSSSSLSFNISDSQFLNNSQYAINNSGAQIDARNNWWGHNSGPEHINNPEGSGQKIIGDVLFDGWTKEIDPVILIPGILGSWKVLGEWELDPILNTYDNLWEAMQDSGYVVDENLFAFPYNWRLSNIYTAGLLKDKIDYVKQITGSSKVDIVAHSMGGLVARAYVELLDYENDIDQLIFLGTPHNGSTRSYFTWEAGEIGPDPADKIKKKVLLLDALKSGYTSIFSYVQEMPLESVRELLPIYDYLNKDDVDLSYPNNYPQNTFLDLLNNESKLSALSNLGEIINIRAETGLSNTITSLKVVDYTGDDDKWEHGYPENFDLIPFTGDGIVYGAGDLTVPSISNESFFNLADIVLDSNHSDIVTDAQKQVIKELTGIEPEQEVRKNMFTKWLMVRIFSPADFQVIAPDGSIIGKDFENNTIINQIDGAFYSGFNTDIEFAVIPDPDNGEYEVVLEGTGDGEYTLITDYISDEEEITQQVIGQAKQNQQIQYNLAYDSEDIENMSITPEDLDSPITSINIIGTSLGENTYEDNAIITLSSIDNNSGVYKIEYSIDNGESWQTYSYQVELNIIGNFEFLYRAIDNVGNLEDTKTALINIQKKQSRGIVPIYIFQTPSQQIKKEEKKEQGKVLGEQAIQEIKYYTDDDILSALSSADINVLLDYLDIDRNIVLENFIQNEFVDFSSDVNSIIFIAYGTKSTQNLGAGERAGVLYSYIRANGNLPKTPNDWMDVLNISNGNIPIKRNKVAEQKTINEFNNIFSRDFLTGQEDDNYAIMKITYGLRPKARDLEREKIGIKKFIEIYKALPNSSFDWDIARCLSYSNINK